MKIKNMNIFKFGLVLLSFLVLLLILDFILLCFFEFENIIIDILELLFSTGTAITLSLSLEVNVNVKKYEKRQKNNLLSKMEKNNIIGESINNTVLTQSLENSINLNTDNSHVNFTYINNDFNAFIELAKGILIPFELNNVQTIVEKSIEELSKKPINQPLSREFILKYIDESKNISEKDIQDIWVKLLMKEVEEQDSVSKRTLDIIKNLKPKEAKIFEKIAFLSDGNGMISKTFEEEYSFIQLSALQDIGLVKSNDLLTKNFSLDNNEIILISCTSNYALMLQNINNKKEKYSLSCHILTSTGMELKEALKIEMIDEKLFELGKSLAKKNNNKNLIFKIFKVNYKNNDIINYDDSINYLEN